MDISELLSEENEKASRKRVPVTRALRDISSSWFDVCRLTVSTLPPSACSFIRNLSTLSIGFFFYSSNLFERAEGPCPFFVWQEFRVDAQVIAQHGVNEDDILCTIEVFDPGLL